MNICEQMRACSVHFLSQGKESSGHKPPTKLGQAMPQRLLGGIMMKYHAGALAHVQYLR